MCSKFCLRILTIWKMSFNCVGLKEAFLAAVKNTENKGKETAEGEEEEHSFLNRLHIHSARLSANVTPSTDDHLMVFSPNNANAAEAEQTKTDQKMEKNCDSDDCENRITIGLSPASVAKLDELFGDGQTLTESVSSVEVNLPIWLCEFLFKAVQKMSISNSLREEYEHQNDLLACDSLAPLQPSNKKVNVSLTRLYEMFPKLPKKLIHQVAKEKDFDFQQTALYLVDYPDEQPIDAPNPVKHSVIVPSLRPRVISAEEQQSNTPNSSHKHRANLLPLLPPEGWDTEVEHVENELRKMEAEQKHCREMRTKYVGAQNWTVSGFYSARVSDLELAKKRLTNYWDRLRIWRTSSEECIDLHEMSVDRAISTVVEKINICREWHPNICKLYVITGYGKTTGSAMIKHRLLSSLKSKGIASRVSPRNEGVIEINLRKVTFIE